MKSFWIPPLSSAPTPLMPRTACSRPVSFPESAVPNLGDQPSSSHCHPCLQTCSCLLTLSPIPLGSISLVSNPLHVISASWPLGSFPMDFRTKPQIFIVWAHRTPLPLGPSSHFSGSSLMAHPSHPCEGHNPHTTGPLSVLFPHMAIIPPLNYSSFRFQLHWHSR